jgi:hypothetical protein
VVETASLSKETSQCMGCSCGDRHSGYKNGNAVRMLSVKYQNALHLHNDLLFLNVNCITISHEAASRRWGSYPITIRFQGLNMNC